jgi:hypothetical protein
MRRGFRSVATLSHTHILANGSMDSFRSFLATVTEASPDRTSGARVEPARGCLSGSKSFWPRWRAARLHAAGMAQPTDGPADVSHHSQRLGYELVPSPKWPRGYQICVPVRSRPTVATAYLLPPTRATRRPTRTISGCSPCTCGQMVLGSVSCTMNSMETPFPPTPQSAAITGRTNGHPTANARFGRQALGSRGMEESTGSW